MITLPKTYSQVDAAWVNYPIGDSTIGAIGCLDTIAADTCTYYGHPETPSTLAQKMSQNGGFLGNYWVWNALSRIYPDLVMSRYPYQLDLVDPLTDEHMAAIKGSIDQGIPVFIKIVTPAIPEHWVLGVGYQGDDIQVADPLRRNGEVHPITDWGIPPRQVIYNFCWYTGPVPATQTVDMGELDELKKTLDFRTREYDKVKTLLQEVNKTLEYKIREYDTVKAQKEEAERKATEFQKRLDDAPTGDEGLAITLEQRLEDIKRRDEEIGRMKTELKTTQSNLKEVSSNYEALVLKIRELEEPGVEIPLGQTGAKVKRTRDSFILRVPFLLVTNIINFFRVYLGRVRW